jgi:hypothetical protein
MLEGIGVYCVAELSAVVKQRLGSLERTTKSTGTKLCILVLIKSEFFHLVNWSLELV